MKTGENFILRFEQLASKNLLEAGYSISVIMVDSAPSNSTEISLKKDSKEYLIWFADNRLDYDSGVMVNLVNPDKNKWESIIYPENRSPEGVLSYYPEQADASIEKIILFLITLND